VSLDLGEGQTRRLIWRLKRMVAVPLPPAASTVAAVLRFASADVATLPPAFRSVLTLALADSAGVHASAVHVGEVQPGSVLVAVDVSFQSPAAADVFVASLRCCARRTFGCAPSPFPNPNASCVVPHYPSWCREAAPLTITGVGVWVWWAGGWGSEVALLDALGPVDALEAQVFNGVEHPPLTIPSTASSSSSPWYADGYVWLLVLGAAILLTGLSCGGCSYVVLRRRQHALVLTLTLPESPHKVMLAMSPYEERRDGATLMLTAGGTPLSDSSRGTGGEALGAFVP
jgi:hypothetical protein